MVVLVVLVVVVEVSLVGASWGEVGPACGYMRLRWSGPSWRYLGPSWGPILAPPSAGLDNLMVNQEEKTLKQHFDIKAPKLKHLPSHWWIWTDSD